MNTIWSDHVQGVQTLYLSRKLRFDDQFFAQYQKVFNLDQTAKLRVLEIGCGPRGKVTSGVVCGQMSTNDPRGRLGELWIIHF